MLLFGAQTWPAVDGRALEAGRPLIAFPAYRLLLGPTNHDWRLPAKMELVERLLDRVTEWCREHSDEALAVAAPGCGLGGLAYGPVRGAVVWRLAAYSVVLLPPGPGPRRRLTIR